MSTSGTQAAETVEHDAHEGHHPTPAEYVRIALILAALTALEVSRTTSTSGAPASRCSSP